MTDRKKPKKASSEKDKTLTLRLSSEKHALIQEVARGRRCSMTDLVTEAIEDKLQELERLIEYEKKATFPCDNCNKPISFYEAKKPSAVCPHCKKRILISD